MVSEPEKRYSEAQEENEANNRESEQQSVLQAVEAQISRQKEAGQLLEELSQKPLREELQA